jgi:hypothetical protein
MESFRRRSAMMGRLLRANQIVKSLPKLVDKATNHGTLHIGAGRVGPSFASS